MKQFLPDNKREAIVFISGWASGYALLALALVIYILVWGGGWFRLAGIPTCRSTAPSPTEGVQAWLKNAPPGRVHLCVRLIVNGHAVDLQQTSVEFSWRYTTRAGTQAQEPVYPTMSYFEDFEKGDLDFCSDINRLAHLKN